MPHLYEPTCPKHAIVYIEGTCAFCEDEENMKSVVSEDDDVNHPSHYTSYKGIEIIQLTEQMNFCRGNAVKYVARAGLKSKQTELKDLKKAAWYIQREIERLESDEKRMSDEALQALRERLTDGPICSEEEWRQANPTLPTTEKMPLL